MTSQRRQDRRWLLDVARAVAGEMKERGAGTRLRIRTPRRATITNTDGWVAAIGDLGKGQPRLEIWLDRFAGYPDRKLYACFRSEARRPFTNIIAQVARSRWPHQTVTEREAEHVRHLVLVGESRKRRLMALFSGWRRAPLTL